MKNIFFACLCIFSFEEAFSQTAYLKPNTDLDYRKQTRDEVSTGQSAIERKTTPAGTMKNVKKYDSIKGVNCTDTNGREFAPNSRGYKKCVDYANRVQ